MIEEVHLVATGAYSDYTVVAAFSTREKAEAWVAEHNGRSIWHGTPDGPLQEQKGNPDDTHGYYVDDAVGLDEEFGPHIGAWTTGSECVDETGDIPSWLRRFSNHTRAINVLYSDDAVVGPPTIEYLDGDAARGIAGYWRVTATGKTPEHAHRSMREILRAIKAGTFILPRTIEVEEKTA